MHRTFHARSRLAAGLVLAGCIVLLAACDRRQPDPGDGSQVAAAKAAVARKLDDPQSAQFREIVEYSDGTVCGEFNSRKLFSGRDLGYRKFIYNAPAPRELVIDSGDLPREEIRYWCSEQPDKRLRMLAASVAELDQACASAGGKASDMTCRLAATQKRNLEELRAAAPKAAPAASAAVAAAPAPAAPSAPSAPTVAPVAPMAPATPATPPPPAPTSAAAPPAATSTAAAATAPAANGIPAEVQAALGNWRDAWQQGNVDAYLRMYDAAFTGGARSRAAWEQERRQKMKNARPSIGIERLQAARVTPQEVELRFVQVYAARQHRDTGNKTMVFRRSPSGWLIADERWVATP